MKTIRLKYVDFWPNFRLEDDPIWIFLSNSDTYNPVVSDDPEYLVYSSFGYEHLKYDAIRVFFTGENQAPDFNVCDYAIGMNCLSFGDRYFRFPFYCHPGYKEAYDLMMQKHTDLHHERNRFCSFVYSNNSCNEIRNEFFLRLSNYRQVDSGGRVMNNVGGGSSKQN